MFPGLTAETREIDHYEVPFNFPSSYERSFSALAFKMSFDSTHIPSPSDDFLYHQPPADHWAAYDQALALQASMSVQFNSYPSAYHQPRLTPPPAPVTPGSQNGGPRLTLAGSLDPSTGIFYRTPEHPRLRTAQACEKCRTRKAKCSGEHPSCKRCQNRGLVCEYAKEGRVRGPNKSKNSKVAGNTTPGDELPRRNQAPGRNGRGSEPADLSQAMIDVLREHDQRLALSTPLSRRGSLSMGEHRPNRPRPPNLNLDISNHHYILDGHGHYSHPDFQIPGTIPVSYRAYEENRSPSTSSSASMHLQNTYLGLQQQHTPMCFSF
ncbi:hypothetical protein F5887DRAFT_968783 [Amanita rubescens]|nr:hypothetical protein F5887DRAFT_968783 [Amanita rubescens]